MKVTLAEVRPWTFRAVCLMASGSVLLALARSGGSRLRVPPEDLWPLVLTSIVNITGWHILSAHGVAAMQAGRAAIVAYTMPLWAIMLSRLLLKEHVTAPRLWALAVGFAGLALLLGPDFQKVGAAPAGVLFMLGAAFCWAAGPCWSSFPLAHAGDAGHGLAASDRRHPGGHRGVVAGSPGGPRRHLLESGGNLRLSHRGADDFLPLGLLRGGAAVPANVAALSTLSIPVIGVFSSALAARRSAEPLRADRPVPGGRRPGPDEFGQAALTRKPAQSPDRLIMKQALHRHHLRPRLRRKARCGRGRLSGVDGGIFAVHPRAR